MKEANAKILLVDDDDSLRRVLEFQLSEAGHSVVSEGDGREALKSYSAEDFDCVITDWRMPKMTGSQLVSQATAINSNTDHCYYSFWRCRYGGRSDARWGF